jgi:tRNA-splicing ligase RtcB
MGTGSFIVRGLGNRELLQLLARRRPGDVAHPGEGADLAGAAHRRDEGHLGRIDEGVLDESPAAYKDIGAVMDAQKDLVAIEHRLRQIINIKG